MAMLYKIFEGICLKNRENVGNIWMSVGFAGRTVYCMKK